MPRDNESVIKLDSTDAINAAWEQKFQEMTERRINDETMSVFNKMADLLVENFGENSPLATLIKDNAKILADKTSSNEDVLQARENLNVLRGYSEETYQRAEQELEREEQEKEREKEKKQREKDEEDRRKEREKKRKDDREALDDRLYGWQKDILSGATDSAAGQMAQHGRSLLSGIYDADLGNLTSGLSGILGSVGEGEIASTGLTAVLEGMGMTGAAEVASMTGSVLGGPIVAAILGGISSTDAIMDRVAQARYAAMQQGLTGWDAVTLGPGTAWQDMFYSFGSGIDARTIQSVRETLFKNQAEWGSDEYNQGFDFAMNAQGRYGISAANAAKYYTEQVVKGGESMEELSRQMEYLHKTVENTSIGMEQMETVVANNTRTLAASMGGDTLAAQSAALDMQRYFTEGTGRESQIAAGMMGNVNFATDPLAYQKMQDYLGQGYDETQAMMLVGMDYVSEGRVLGTYGGINYFTTPLDEGRDSLQYYLENRDWEGLEAALTDFWDGNALNPAMTYFGLRAALKAQFGFTDQDVESPETITNAFRSAYGGMDNAAEGGDFEYQQDIATDIDERRFTNPNSYMGLGWSLRGTRNIDELMSGEGDINLWSDNGGQFINTGIELMQQMVDAGVTLDDQMSETELNAIATGLREAYSSAETDMSFSDWLHTSEGVSQAQQIADKMDMQPITSESSTTRYGVEISFVDDAATFLRAFVREIDDTEQRDSGGQVSA